MDIFVGREEEQEKILGLFVQAREGTGQAVFVTGSPGIGKTYLIEHIFGSMKGARFLRSRCSEDDQPYEAITKLLRKYTEMERHQLYGKEAERYAENAKKCREVARSLGSPDKETEASGQRALFSLVEDTLFSIAKYTPLAIFIDNLQVADASSMEFLSSLVGSIDDLPILFIGAFREEEVPDDHMLRIMSIQEDETTHMVPLEPLAALDILDMVEKLMDVSDLPTRFIKRLYKETKGNPLFVREVVMTIMEDKNIDRSDPYWYTKIDLGSVPLPGSLKEIVISQVKALDQDTKAVLRFGAAIGGEFSGATVGKTLAREGIMPSTKVGSILSSLTASKMLRNEDGIFKFEYPELQQLVYGKVESNEKTHLALAETLEEMNADVYSIAKQYSLSGDLEKTWRYREKAGDQAGLSLAPMDAERHFSEAFDALKKATKGKRGKAAKYPDWVRILLKHGNVAHSLGEVDSALTSYKGALKIAKKTKDDLLIAETHRKIGDVHRTRSQWDEAKKEFKASLDLVGKKKDKHGMAESLRGLGYVNWRRGEFDKATSRYSNALKYAEETKDIPLVGVILIEFGNVYNEKGELDKALRYYLKSVDILTKTKEYFELARAYNNIGDTYLQLGQWKNAVAFFKKTGAVSEKIGNKSMMGWALFNASEALAKGGSPDKALKYAEGALKILERIGDNIGLSGVYKGFGIAYRFKKDWAKAEENFERSMELGQEANSPYTLAEIYLEAGCFYHDKGDEKKMGGYLAKAEEIGKDIGAKVLVERVKKERKRSNA